MADGFSASHPHQRRALSMPGQGLIRALRVRLGLSGNPKTPPVAERTHQRLAILIESLTFAEKAAEATPVPYLKGAIGFALEVVKCVQGYRSNNEEMNRLAQNCATLILNITNQASLSGGMPQNIEPLVQNLCGTLEMVQNTAKDIGNTGSRTHRFLAQKNNSERLAVLSREVTDAQLAFLVNSSRSEMIWTNLRNRRLASSLIAPHKLR
ncbi:hypothetical protein C8R45DRAFT_1026163 [Mycena sanguinolenta]|nr:hypothetical protein C8R45DRAFT_1026163 [Mycena sanguinolenta]